MGSVCMIILCACVCVCVCVKETRCRLSAPAITCGLDCASVSVALSCRGLEKLICNDCKDCKDGKMVLCHADIPVCTCACVYVCVCVCVCVCLHSIANVMVIDLSSATTHTKHENNATGSIIQHRFKQSAVPDSVMDRPLVCVPRSSGHLVLHTRRRGLLDQTHPRTVCNI